MVFYKLLILVVFGFEYNYTFLI